MGINFRSFDIHSAAFFRFFDFLTFILAFQAGWTSYSTDKLGQRSAGALPADPCWAYSTLLSKAMQILKIYERRSIPITNALHL